MARAVVARGLGPLRSQCTLPSVCCACLLPLCALFQPFQLLALVASGRWVDKLEISFFLSSSLAALISILYCFLYTLLRWRVMGRLPENGRDLCSLFVSSLPAVLIYIQHGTVEYDRQCPHSKENHNDCGQAGTNKKQKKNCGSKGWGNLIWRVQTFHIGQRPKKKRKLQMWLEERTGRLFPSPSSFQHGVLFFDSFYAEQEKEKKKKKKSGELGSKA